MGAEAFPLEGDGTGMNPWAVAVVAGITGGIGMGIVLSIGTNLLPVIGGIYGFGTFIGGWIAHLGFSVFWAVVFVFVLSQPIVRHERLGLATITGLGIGYGAFLGLVVGGVLFPFGVNLMGLESGLSVPYLPLAVRDEVVISSILFVVAHLVYGAVLGVVYPILSRSVSDVSI